MNYIRKRLEGLDAADRDPDEPPTTPRKEKQKVFAASPRSTPSQMHTPDSEPVEEVTQTSATQYVAALRYHDPKQTPKDAATTLGRLFNQNVALRPAIVVRALPMLKNAKATGLVTVTIDVDVADGVALASLERQVVLAELSMRYTTDFFGLPDDSDFPLLMATLSEYFEQNEIEKRRVDKTAEPLVYDFRFMMNADMYHRDVVYLRDAGASGGMTMSILAISVDVGTAVDVIKNTKIPQETDFLYLTEDGEIAKGEGEAVGQRARALEVAVSQYPVCARAGFYLLTYLRPRRGILYPKRYHAPCYH